jgi:hypothetical protein
VSDQSPNPGPTPAQIQQLQQQQAVAAALRGAVPRLYANGVGVAQSASDVSIVLISNLSAVGVVSMSYITAKTLVTDLNRAILNFEKVLNQKVKSIEEITPELQKLMEKQNATLA